MVYMANNVFFEGDAPLGIVDDGCGDVRCYCVDDFGIENGRFSASFHEFLVEPAIDEDEAERMLTERLECYLDGADAQERLELCERFDCSPNNLPYEYAKDYVSAFDYDAFAALNDWVEGVASNAIGKPLIVLAGGGQHDMFDELTSFLLDESLVNEIRHIWRNWHLNDLTPGTERQMAALREAKLDGRLGSYEQQCDYLKSIGLYEDELDGKPYVYGSGWVTRELPTDIYERVGAIVGALYDSPSLEQAVAQYLEANPDALHGNR